jgi:hypothetical protein
MKAFSGAIRSPMTWLTGAVVMFGGVAIGQTLGNAVFGRGGAIVGTAVGACGAIWCFLTVVLPWRTRHPLRSPIEHAGNSTIDQVQQVNENVTRMIDEYKRRDGRQ